MVKDNPCLGDDWHFRSRLPNSAVCPCLQRSSKKKQVEEAFQPSKPIAILRTSESAICAVTDRLITWPHWCLELQATNHIPPPFFSSSPRFPNAFILFLSSGLWTLQLPAFYLSWDPIHCPIVTNCVFIRSVVISQSPLRRHIRQPHHIRTALEPQIRGD